MASSKERERWSRWYDKVQERIEQQKQSITRLILINTEALAALHEIAAMEPEEDKAGDGAEQDRAQEALDRIEEIAAAVRQSVEESEADPIPDPRQGGRGK